MKRLTWIAPLAFIGIMLGGVGVAQLTGEWVSTGGAGAGAGQGAGAGSGSGVGEGDGAGAGGGSAVSGTLTPDTLRGRMTLQEAADGLGITVEELAALINPDDPALLTGDTAFKEIEGLVPGFELSGFRAELAAYLAARPSAPDGG